MKLFDCTRSDIEKMGAAYEVPPSYWEYDEDDDGEDDCYSDEICSEELDNDIE